MKEIKVTCIGVDPEVSEWHTKGRKYIITVYPQVGKPHSMHNRKVTDDMGNGQMNVQRMPGDKHQYRMLAFEGTIFDAAPHRFRKSNRSAAFGQVEIDYSRCKRSIRNQARNIAKEHFSCGKLEKIARGYKR